MSAREWWLNFGEDGALQEYWWRFKTLCWLRGHDMHESHSWEEFFHNYDDCWCSCSRCDYGYRLHPEWKG